MPPRYAAPIDELRHTLDHVAGLAQLASLPGYGHADAETVEGLLEAFGRFVEEVVAPLDVVGDRHGVTLDPDTGAVRTAPGFREAYGRYVDGGWAAVSFPPELGGGGFPWVVGLALQEMLTSACMALSLAPMLTQGAVDMLRRYGTEAQRAAYHEALATGRWTGTMNLTEPQAGSDLALVRTRAEPGPDGTWLVTGTKIFITWGEHDLTDNIVHLVLARAPGAPEGTRGISCFLVPKVLPDGTRNDVRCVSVEHKLGIHASPTCVMSYGDDGGAQATLVGEVHEGMRAMFTMMNSARLLVGLEGLAIGERALQAATAYAGERLQGRRPGGAPGTAVEIDQHPDVRRMLVHMRAHTEAMRSLIYLVGSCVDRSERGRSDEERADAQDWLELLTPVAKAWCTDVGVELASLAVQVHGGVGYIEETGVAQLLRDSRIAPIYEGTNGIQAVDLVTRRLPRKDGAVVRGLLDDVAAFDDDLEVAGPELADVRRRLADAVTATRSATDHLLAVQAAGHVDDALAGATAYLRLLAELVGGWFLARGALFALRARELGDDDAERLGHKVDLARYYGEHVLAGADGRRAAACAGAAVLGRG